MIAFLLGHAAHDHGAHHLVIVLAAAAVGFVAGYIVRARATVGARR